MGIIITVLIHLQIYNAGWLGYSDELIRSLCKKYLRAGFTAFKIKVGQDLENDIKRCKLVRDEIGWSNKLVSG